MTGPLNPKVQPPAATRRTAIGLILGAPLLGACSSVQQTLSQFSNPFSSSEGPAGPPQEGVAVGTGQFKVGLILPLSGAGNAGVAAQSMKNAAEMALAEFQNPNIQPLIKDDGATPQGAGQSTQQALSEGAEIILGPLFALSVPATAQLARTRGVSVIAFSTDSSVAGRGVYLLSFLPESDINRSVDYATPARTVAQSLGSADALLIADDGESVVATADALTAAGANLRNIQLLGTGLWDNPRVFASPSLQGGLYAAPDPAGFRSFSARYRAKFGSDPVRTATLAYDAVALVAALARTQGAQRFAPETLTNPSGFAGIDGLFRFRSDGTNERGLAVMKVTSGGGTPVAGSPKSFGA